MSKYYYLIAGLPELALEDNKLYCTLADFKSEYYPFLSKPDRKLLDLFYLQFDNLNLLKLLRDRDASIDLRGLYSKESLLEGISMIKEGAEIAEPQLPSYMSIFLINYFKESFDTSVLWDDRLAALYYAYALRCKNRFMIDWFDFNLTVNNVLIALTARKYKLDIAPHIVGDTVVCDALRTSNARDFGLSGSIDYWEQLAKAGETEDLVEREKKIDQLRWNWLEEHSTFKYFTVERIIVFFQQLSIIERWIPLDKEKGNKMFRSIIAALKDEVQIPGGFR